MLRNGYAVAQAARWRSLYVLAFFMPLLGRSNRFETATLLNALSPETDEEIAASARHVAQEYAAKLIAKQQHAAYERTHPELRDPHELALFAKEREEVEFDFTKVMIDRDMDPENARDWKTDGDSATAVEDENTTEQLTDEDRKKRNHMADLDENFESLLADIEDNFAKIQEAKDRVVLRPGRWWGQSEVKSGKVSICRYHTCFGERNLWGFFVETWRSVPVDEVRGVTITGKFKDVLATLKHKPLKIMTSSKVYEGIRPVDCASVCITAIQPGAFTQFQNLFMTNIARLAWAGALNGLPGGGDIGFVAGSDIPGIIVSEIGKAGPVAAIVATLLANPTPQSVDTWFGWMFRNSNDKKIRLRIQHYSTSTYGNGQACGAPKGCARIGNVQMTKYGNVFTDGNGKVLTTEHIAIMLPLLMALAF